MSSSRSDSSEASVADVVMWGRVVCRIVVAWVCARMPRDFQTFPKHESDWRVGSKISDLLTV